MWPVLFDPVFLKPPNEMHVVRVALLLSALLATAAAASIEVPAAKEFYKDNGIAAVTDDEKVPYPKAEEESLDPMSVSGEDNFVGDKSPSIWWNIMFGIGIGIGSTIISCTFCVICYLLGSRCNIRKSKKVAEEDSIDATLA